MIRRSLEKPSYKEKLRIRSYSEVFDDIFPEYTTRSDLVRVKTTDMGSLFKLTYSIALRDSKREKEMLDKIRCRNGNLEIAISSQETTAAEL